ncbi:MAG: hypothetical protein ABSF34_07530, partial [Verrucomicrobiota bacterium]
AERQFCLPDYIMAGRLLKMGADGPKRLARTLAPPKRANKNRKTCFLQNKEKSARDHIITR